MTDLLVKLYQLPALEPELAAQQAQGISIRRAIAPEKHFVTGWVAEHFSPFWQSECEVAFAHLPIGCWIAIQDKHLIGFSCSDTTAFGFCGPMGVSEEARGHGIGRALLLAALHGMRWQGYGYAVIGHVGPVEFYQKTVGATVIEDSTPGIYDGLLRQ